MPAASTPSIGIDFGTSNSVVALANEGDDVDLLEFALLGAATNAYRSLLFFEPDEQEVRLPIQFTAGTDAIEAYLDALGEGRLVQSFKTHLTTATLGRTLIGHHQVSLDDMLALFFLRLRQHAEAQWSVTPDHAVVGRPVRFAGSESDDDSDKAQARLEAAATKAGFTDVRFEYEPIAAAYHYERALSHPELALVADFGAGTTDFCLMRLDPGRHRIVDRHEDIVATGGVGVAGDDLDAAIIEHVVCPSLGRGSMYRDMGRTLPIPSSYYFKLARWHHLSFLKGKRTRAELERLHQLAEDPDAIARFMHIVENNQGFHLHKAVEQLKIALSGDAVATFRYDDGPVSIEQDVKRADFEEWIAEHVEAIAGALDETLAKAGVEAKEVDRVFMTGGTAFVPCVRQRFVDRFGAERLAGGDELTSIASGLALHARR